MSADICSQPARQMHRTVGLRALDVWAGSILKIEGVGAREERSAGPRTRQFRL